MTRNLYTFDDFQAAQVRTRDLTKKQRPNTERSCAHTRPTLANSCQLLASLVWKLRWS